MQWGYTFSAVGCKNRVTALLGNPELWWDLAQWWDSHYILFIEVFVQYPPSSLSTALGVLTLKQGNITPPRKASSKTGGSHKIKGVGYGPQSVGPLNDYRRVLPQANVVSTANLTGVESQHSLDLSSTAVAIPPKVCFETLHCASSLLGVFQQSTLQHRGAFPKRISRQGFCFPRCYTP